nr:multidrug and toxin extrusion protein 2 isoform X1 [Crassostrea gigas]
MWHLCNDVDVGMYREELTELVKLAWPMSLQYLMNILPRLVSQGFCGHIGKEEGDGVALSINIVSALGYAVLLGLSSGADTLFSQIQGSGNKEELGVVLQKGTLIMLLCCFPCCAILLNTDLICRLVGQDEEVSRVAGEYVTIMMSGLPGHGLTLLLSKFIQVQSVFLPSLIIGIIINVENVALHALFIYALELGIRGAAIAVVLSQWTSAILHVLFIACTDYKKDTWKGWNKLCLNGWSTFLNLAVPGIFMMCLEFWTGEVTTFFTGLTSKTELAAFVSLLNVGLIITGVVFGISVAVSMRVGIHLGAGNADRANLSTRVAFCFGSCLGAVIAVLIISLKDVIPHFFSNNETVVFMATSFTPLLAIFKFFEIYQIMCTGILRGIGFQTFGAVVNFIGNFLIGLPVALSLMLASPLRVAGAWWGLIAGAVVLCVAFTIRIISVDWKQESIKARKRAGMKIEDMTCIVNDEAENMQLGTQTREIKDYKSFDISAQSGNVSSNSAISSATHNLGVYSKVVTLVIVSLIFAGGLSLRLYVNV